MTSQALSGVIALRLVLREGSPSLLEVRHTHTHTRTDRETNTLALRGLEEPVFQLCCCVVLVFGSGGK